MRGETQGNSGEQNAFECSEADHLLLQCPNAVFGDGTELSCLTQYKKCDA
jgi:hypothetical protein